MQKDSPESLEALLLRHYGHTASVPAGLEERLLASVRQETAESRKEQQAASRLRQNRISRRHVFRLIATETAKVGIDALNAGFDSLQVLESALTT